MGNKKIIAIAYSFVFEVVVTIGVGFLLGRLLDKWLNTNILFTILFMMIGVFGSLYLLVRRVNKVEDQNEE